MAYNSPVTDNGEARRRTGRRGLWIIAGVAAVGATLAVVGIWHLPPRMYPATDQSEARAALQGGLLTAAAALLAVAGGLIALDETRQANAEIRRANENTHVRELYATAIGLLSSPTVDGRLGGIYALERVATDSPADQRTVVDVLSAFIREHTRPSATSDGAALATDVQAALTVLGRLPMRPKGPRADLSGTRLTRANLADAWLPWADLRGARLVEATLVDARLGWANLAEASLERADLTGARMGGSILINVSLAGANLHHARLTGANLTGASLERADLTEAVLDGADLAGAARLTQAQVDAALGDGKTRLPAGLVRPAAWGREEPHDE